jgi:hypothetical protein
VFLDESGFMLTPTVRRTLAPRGETPILESWDRHDRISAISAITVSPKRRRIGLYFRLPADDTNVRGGDVVEFLRELRRQLPLPMTILWDKGNVHDRSKVVRAYLADHPSLETEPFPSYTPEANPDEGMWIYRTLRPPCHTLRPGGCSPHNRRRSTAAVDRLVPFTARQRPGRRVMSHASGDPVPPRLRRTRRPRSRSAGSGTRCPGQPASRPCGP